MKTFALASGVAASLLLLTGGILLWQGEEHSSKLVFEAAPLESDQSHVSSVTSVPSKPSTFSTPTLNAEQINEALSLLQSEGTLSELEMAMVMVALYQKHENQAIAQSQSSALHIALENLRQNQGNGQSIVYKAREKKILKEIMMMDSLPEGVTPQEYLHNRLNKLKQTVVAEGQLPTN